jgi:hypothetical protein
MRTLIAVLLLAITVVYTQEAPKYCWHWTYPEKPEFPHITNVVPTITAQPDGFLFNVTNIPLMDNALLTIPDYFIGPRDQIPDEKQDGLSSGTTCHFEQATLVCPKDGSIFSNPRFQCTKSSYGGLNCVWKLTIKEVMHAGRVKKERKGDTTYLTFYYYLSYLTPERIQSIQLWGHANQDLFQFHASISQHFTKDLRTAEVYSTYFYYVRPETFQPVEYITVSTSNNGDVILDATPEPSPLNFFKTLEWADKGYSLFQFEANYGIPKDKKPINATLAFRGTYCTEAKKDANSGEWVCKYNDPFYNVNDHVFQSIDANEKTPAVLTANAKVYHCTKLTKGGDCKVGETGPVPIGSGLMYVIWKSEQLSAEEFEFDPAVAASARLFFEDSWLGAGLKEFKFLPGDEDILYPKDFPADIDPEINPENRLMMIIRFNPTKHLEDIDPFGGWLNMTVGVKPKGMDSVNIQGNVAVQQPTIMVTSSRPSKGPMATPFSMPSYAYLLIGIGSTAIATVFIVGTVFAVRRLRQKRYAELA